jgi:hypothetical protein
MIRQRSAPKGKLAAVLRDEVGGEPQQGSPPKPKPKPKPSPKKPAAKPASEDDWDSW